MSISMIARTTALNTLNHGMLLSCRWVGQATVVNRLAHQNINRWLVTSTVPLFQLFPLYFQVFASRWPRWAITPLSLHEVALQTVKEELAHIASQWTTNFTGYPLKQTSAQMCSFFAFDLFYAFTLTLSHAVSHHRYSPLHDLPDNLKPIAFFALRVFICMIIFPLPLLVCVSAQKAHLAAQEIIMALFIECAEAVAFKR